MEVAGQQHVADVVPGAVVELAHVEGARLEVVEVGFHLQALQNSLLHKVYVPDLIPGDGDREGQETLGSFQMQISCPVV